MKSKLALLAVLCFFASSCVAYPFDTQNYATRGTLIDFIGFSYEPDKTVVLQVCSNSSSWCTTGTAKTLKTTKTGSTPAATDNHGNNWYAYSVKMAVPSGYWFWVSSTGKYRANVRAMIDDTEPFTYYNDPQECPQAWGADQILIGGPSCAKAPTASNGTGNPATHGWTRIYAAP
jgi:hypothetical protein